MSNRAKMNKHLNCTKLQDKKELERFSKFLVLKAAQIIIESRSGKKITTKCKLNSSGMDWFNLAVEDSEITVQAERVLTKNIINSSVPFCIEISLKASDGNSKILEIWSVGVASNHKNSTVPETFSIYSGMGRLLKSLLLISRITPVYKLSRAQEPDSYTICYRMYMDKPELVSLGNNCKYVNVGELRTPLGMIYISMCYCKNLSSFSDNILDSTMLTSHYFDSNLKRLNQRKKEKVISLSETIKGVAFVSNKRMFIQKEESINIPFSSLLISQETEMSPSPISVTKLPAQFTDSIMTTTITKSSNSSSDTIDGTTSKCSSPSRSRKNSSPTTDSSDDFIVIEFKPPFIETDTNNDLVNFFRECRIAPQLRTSTEDTTLEEQVGDLMKQLETFETDMHCYEELVNSLCKMKKSY